MQSWRFFSYKLAFKMQNMELNQFKLGSINKIAKVCKTLLQLEIIETLILLKCLIGKIARPHFFKIRDEFRLFTNFYSMIKWFLTAL